MVPHMTPSCPVDYSRILRQLSRTFPPSPRRCDLLQLSPDDGRPRKVRPKRDGGPPRTFEDKPILPYGSTSYISQCPCLTTPSPYFLGTIPSLGSQSSPVPIFAVFIVLTFSAPLDLAPRPPVIPCLSPHRGFSLGTKD